MNIYRKVAGQMDTYNSIRKPMAPHDSFMDDGRGKSKRIKDIGSDMDVVDIEQLKNEANISCEIKGHQLGEWNDFSKGNRNLSYSTCINCGKEVQVIDKPQAEERDMSGDALLTQCSTNSGEGV